MIRALLLVVCAVSFSGCESMSNVDWAAVGDTTARTYQSYRTQQTGGYQQPTYQPAASTYAPAYTAPPAYNPYVGY